MNVKPDIYCRTKVQPRGIASFRACVLFDRKKNVFLFSGTQMVWVVVLISYCTHFRFCVVIYLDCTLKTPSQWNACVTSLGIFLESSCNFSLCHIHYMYVCLHNDQKFKKKFFVEDCSIFCRFKCKQLSPGW